MRRGGWLVALALMASLALAPLLAQANHQSPEDGNDTRGVLDVRRVDVKGTRSKPKWRVATSARWDARTIWDKGYALVYFDVLGNEHFDHYALVGSNGFGLEGSLWRDRRQKPDARIGALHVARSDRRSFTVRVPLRRLDIPRARLTYRWYVQTILVNGRCPRSCLDRVPNDGAVTEPVPEPNVTSPPPTPPLPSITPSLSPRPSGSPRATVSPRPSASRG
ncbi:MAG TPA: hypothetical protein VIG64_01995 [Actinomycetota bacterium]